MQSSPNLEKNVHTHKYAEIDGQIDDRQINDRMTKQMVKSVSR